MIFLTIKTHFLVAKLLIFFEISNFRKFYASTPYKSYSRYMNLDSLNGSVMVTKNNEDVLYYVIIKNGDA